MAQIDRRTSERGETLRLAAFCSDLDFKALNEEVVGATEKSLADTLAACYAGAGTDAGRRIREHAESFGGGEATVIGGEGGVSAPFAALANGTSAHGLEVDDGHRGGSVHPGSPTIPAALSVAEKYDRSGQELVTAIVAGYEATIKTASAVQPSHRERHFHATATCGCFGAAAAASSLLGLDEETTAAAFGLAGTQAGGLFEFLAKGSMAKRFHPGRAGMAGVMAAELAATGFDGPDTIIEGEEGFVNAFADEYDPTPFAMLGEPYSITRTYLKPYPCCRHIHGPIQAISEIREVGVRPSDVERIRVETYRSASYHDKTAIETLLDAQMSIPYGMAIALSTGETTLDQFAPAHANEGDVAKLMDVTEVVVSDELESIYPETRPATVILETVDGQTHESTIKYPLGSAENPLSEKQVAAKFRDLSDEALDRERQAEILEEALSVAEIDSVKAFAERL